MQSYHPPNAKKQWISSEKRRFSALLSLVAKSRASPELTKLGAPGKFRQNWRVKEKVSCREDKSSRPLPAYSAFLINTDAHHVSASGLTPVL